MKRFFGILLAVTLCVSMFSSCTNPSVENNDSQTSTDSQTTTDNNIDSVTINSFSEYLDTENFVAGVSQAEFLSQLQKYKYEGDEITDVVIGTHYDGVYGGGYSAHGDFFGFNNDYCNTEKQKKYTNSFNSSVALEGLVLPYGIEFGDSLIKVFQKIGIEIDPYDEFVIDENSERTMTLSKSENESLVLENYKAFPLKNYKYGYTLKYIETESILLSDEQVNDVTRTVQLSFVEGDVLGYIAMSVVEVTKHDYNDGIRVFDQYHPDDSEKNPYFSYSFPEEYHLKVEYKEDSKVYANDVALTGGPANGCHSFYLSDLTADGFPEFCFGMNQGSGVIDMRVEIIDYATRETVFSLSDRGIHDYYLFLRDGTLCVKETEYMKDDAIRTGVLTYNATGITVVWDSEVNDTVDRDIPQDVTT